MKIIIAVNELNVVGGTTTFSALLIEQLKSIGHEVCMVGITSPIKIENHQDAVIFEKPVNMQDLSLLEVKKNLKKLRFKQAMKLCLDYYKIMKIANHTDLFAKTILQDADVIIALHAHIGYCMSHHYPNKTIVQFHTDFNILISNAQEKKYVDYLLLHNIRIGFISKIYEQSAIAYGFSNTFYNYNYPIIPTKVSNRTKRVFYYGRFSVEKNLALWIDIASHILEKVPDVSFELYGDGPMLDDIIQKITDLGLSDNIKVFGFCSDINTILQQGGVFMLTSDFEGTPMTIVECLYANIVCAVLDTFGAAKELVIKDKSGILETKDQMEIFISKIVDVLKDTHIYDQYIVNSSVLHEKFDSTAITTKWVQEIQNITHTRCSSE